MILSRMSLLSLLVAISLFILTGYSGGLLISSSHPPAPNTNPVPIASLSPTVISTPPPTPLVPSQPAPPAMPVRVMGMSFVDPSHGWLLGNKGEDSSMPVALASTVDGGKTWQPLPLPAELDPAYDFEFVR